MQLYHLTDLSILFSPQEFISCGLFLDMKILDQNYSPMI